MWKAPVQPLAQALDPAPDQEQDQVCSLSRSPLEMFGANTCQALDLEQAQELVQVSRIWSFVAAKDWANLSKAPDLAQAQALVQEQDRERDQVSNLGMRISKKCFRTND